MALTAYPPLNTLPDVAPDPNEAKLRLEALRLASSLGYKDEVFVIEAAAAYLTFLKGHATLPPTERL